MADAIRREALNLKGRLLDAGQRYAFYQAYRLLRLVSLQEGRVEAQLRVRPNLTLGFQKTDIDQIQERQDGDYDLSVNFLGLYGVSSPLPTFYTEDLLDEALEDRNGSRNFLDILNQTLYPLFFRAWLKTKFHLRLVEFEDERLLDKFYAFVGFSNPKKYRDKPGFGDLLRFAGIFVQQSRSALGLKTIVSGLYPQTEVEVVQQDERVIPIASDQRCCLGVQANTLGDDSHLGQQVRSRSTNLCLRLKNVDEDLFHKLLPGQVEYRRLKFLVRYYLTNPWDVRLQLQLQPDVAHGVSLNEGRWSSLGKDTWISPQTNQPFSVNLAI